MWLHKHEVKALHDRLTGLETKMTALTSAFDKFFDVVAEDLGLEAATEWTSGSYSLGMMGFQYKSSPRQLAEDVTPEKRAVRRKATARCPKRKRASA